jgi:hypothetical protein
MTVKMGEDHPRPPPPPPPLKPLLCSAGFGILTTLYSVDNQPILTINNPHYTTFTVPIVFTPVLRAKYDHVPPSLNLPFPPSVGLTKPAYSIHYRTMK